MQTKTLSEKVKRVRELIDGEEWHLFEEIIKELQEELAISYDANARLSKENEALLAKNKELEEELQERKAYIVANPCAQCGGRINAMKCDAWAKKAKELEGKVEMQRNFMIELEIELLAKAKGIGCKKFEEILEKLDKQGE